MFELITQHHILNAQRFRREVQSFSHGMHNVFVLAVERTVRGILHYLLQIQLEFSEVARDEFQRREGGTPFDLHPFLPSVQYMKGEICLFSTTKHRNKKRKQIGRTL